MSTIKQLHEVSRNDISQTGGKGAALGEMIAANIPVPPGFVVTTTAFNTFMRANNLQDNPTAEAIESAPLLPEFIQEVQAAFDRLGTFFVAVRSSATAEDDSAHTWAGQLESYVPTSRDLLLTNIKKCWASLYSRRAIAYRTKAGLANVPVSVAVVVQKMIDSDVSGIAFSVHPVTGKKEHMVVEAVFGLGESAVSGRVTPDTYVVDKTTHDIVELYPSDQNLQLTRSINGDAEWTPVANNNRKLMPHQLTELAKHVKNIESHFGFACDVEWALQDGKLYIVQSRPITTFKNV